MGVWWNKADKLLQPKNIWKIW